MIQTSIERILVEFIARNYIADGYATGTVDLSETVLDLAAPYDGQQLRIRPGETVEGQVFPAIHVVAEQGDEDEVGNQSLTATISIVFPADGDAAVEDYLTRLAIETERVIGWTFDDAIGEQAAALCTLTTDASIIGVPSRGSRRSFDGHLAVHELTLQLYCAGLMVH